MDFLPDKTQNPNFRLDYRVADQMSQHISDTISRIFAGTWRKSQNATIRAMTFQKNRFLWRTAVAFPLLWRHYSAYDNVFMPHHKMMKEDGPSEAGCLRKWDLSPGPYWSDPSQVGQTHNASYEARFAWKLWKISFPNELLLNADWIVIRIESSMKSNQTFSISISSKTSDCLFAFQGSFHIYSEIIIYLLSKCDFYLPQPVMFNEIAGSSDKSTRFSLHLLRRTESGNRSIRIASWSNVFANSILQDDSNLNEIAGEQ